MNEFPIDPADYKKAHNSLNNLDDAKLKVTSDNGATNPGADGGTTPTSHGVAVVSYAEASSGGAGYTSPLVESNTKPRTYFNERIYVSSEGLLCMITKPLKDIYFNDSSTTPQEVLFTLKEPSTPV